MTTDAKGTWPGQREGRQVLREPDKDASHARLSAIFLLSATVFIGACTADSPVPPLGLALADIEESSSTSTASPIDVAAVETTDELDTQSTLVAQGDTDGSLDAETQLAIATQNANSQPVAAPSGTSISAASTTADSTQTAPPPPIELAAQPVAQTGHAPTSLNAQALALSGGRSTATAIPTPKPLPRSIPRAANQGTALALAEPPKPIRLERPVSVSAGPAAPASRPTVIANAPLPGVDKERLFEIKRTDGLTDNSDIDIDEGASPPVRMASLSGLARLAPNGLKKQHNDVDVNCLKPALVRVLKQVEGKFGRPVVVTSGFRSPARNSRARGAKRSLHMFCAAADIQVDGVSKWTLAEYLRSMPGRGGVGTYCHTNSVHIDVGPQRDWNWRCKRRRRG